MSTIEIILWPLCLSSTVASTPSFKTVIITATGYTQGFSERLVILFFRGLRFCMAAKGSQKLHMQTNMLKKKKTGNNKKDPF